MGDAVTKIKTDSALLEALQRASSVKQTPDEIFQQRVSFIYGSMKPDSNVTRERIKQILLEQEGARAA